MPTTQHHNESVTTWNADLHQTGCSQIAHPRNYFSCYKQRLRTRRNNRKLTSSIYNTSDKAVIATLQKCACITC